MIQTTIVIIFALLTGLLGVYANVEAKNSPQAIALFIMLYSTIVYFGIYQIQCFVKGGCIFSSWSATGIFLVTLYGIAYVYYVAVRYKRAKVQNDAVMNVNPMIKNVITYVDSRYELHNFSL